MKQLQKQENTAIKFLVLSLSAIAVLWLMALFDVFEWFFYHSRKYEVFDYDELALFSIIFLFFLMVWLAKNLYQNARFQTIESLKAKNADCESTKPFFDDSPKKIKQFLSKSYKSPVFLFVSLVLLIGAVELLDMFVLHKMPQLPFHLEALFDAAFLIILAIPGIYFTFFRPLVQQIVFREHAEQRLITLNHNLENRVAQRTEQLQYELEERKRIDKMIIQHQTELRNLAFQLSMTEERERSRIAKELHDNIGHTLAIINNRLELLKSTKPNDRETEIQHIKEFVSAAIRFSRNLSSELSSPLVEDLPLDSALAWLAEEILEGNNISFDIKTSATNDFLMSESRFIIMRAIKEILVNIIKHAKADKVEIYLRSDAENITVEIRDNGIGFKVAEVLELKPSRKQGIGLFNIREQMTAFGGELSISSDPGHGTVVTLALPRKNNKIPGGRNGNTSSTGRRPQDIS